MPVPPPMSDPAHLEARMLVLSDILNRAVAETNKIMEEIRCSDKDEPINTTGCENDE